MKSRALGLAWFLLGMGLCGGETAMAVVQDPVIGEGMTVTLEYTLTLPDKTVADTNVGKAPFSYVHGAGQIVPGLERALTGMKKGQSKHVEVEAVDAERVAFNNSVLTWQAAHAAPRALPAEAGSPQGALGSGRVRRPAARAQREAGRALSEP